MGRGAPKGRRGRAAVLRGGAAGATVALARFARRAWRRATVALARFARQVGAFVCRRRVAAGPCAGERLARRVGRGGFCAGEGLARGVSADRRRVAAGSRAGERLARRVGRNGLARGKGLRAAFLRTGVRSRRAMRCPCGQRGPCAGEQLPRGVPADRRRVAAEPCAGKQLPRGHRAPRPCLRPRPGKKWPATALCQSPAIFPASVCDRARGYVRACSCATGCSCPAASSF